MKITSTLAFAVSLTLLACGGPQERKAQYRARAQEYIQAGNFPKAGSPYETFSRLTLRMPRPISSLPRSRKRKKIGGMRTHDCRQVVELTGSQERAHHPGQVLFGSPSRRRGDTHSRQSSGQASARSTGNGIKNRGPSAAKQHHPGDIPSRKFESAASHGTGRRHSACYTL